MVTKHVRENIVFTHMLGYLRIVLFKNTLFFCNNSSHRASHRTANQDGTFAFYTYGIFQTTFRLPNKGFLEWHRVGCSKINGYWWILITVNTY